MILSRGERAALYAGNCPKLSREGARTAKKGDVLDVSLKMWVEVTEVRTILHPGKPAGWSLGYTVHDHRDPARLLRHVPPDPRKKRATDPTAEEIAQAGVESSYTSAVFSAVPDAGEAVPVGVQKRFAREGWQDKLKRLLEEERRIKERGLEDRLAAVRRAALESGVDVTRQLLAIERRIDAAEAIVRKYGKAA